MITRVISAADAAGSAEQRRYAAVTVASIAQQGGEVHGSKLDEHQLVSHLHKRRCWRRSAAGIQRSTVPNLALQRVAAAFSVVTLRSHCNRHSWQRLAAASYGCPCSKCRTSDVYISTGH